MTGQRTLPSAVAQQAEPKYGLTLGATRELLLPTTLLGCFAIYYLLEQPFWVVLACALPMLALYAFAPVLAARSMASFDRDAIGLLAKRDAKGLRGRYDRALGMRLFSPPGLRAERKAMVLAESGDTRGARDAYREAHDEHSGRPPLRVLLGYAHASFALRDDSRAIELYRALLLGGSPLPGVERNLAHALVRSGEELDEALTILERCEREPAPAPRQHELKLLRALAHAKRGDLARARELVDEAGSHEQTAELRTELAALLHH
jgi:tetratricopeptide (TPR) repeat protein